MLTDTHLADAVRQGIISADQAESLRSLSKREEDSLTDDHVRVSGDDEGFRFISGFADIFLAIGAAVLLRGLMGIAAADTVSGLVIFLAVTWGLAEIFATWQRRTLPSMVCAGFFVAFATGLGVLVFYGVSIGDIVDSPFNASPLLFSYERVPLIALLAAVIFYARFRLPFSLFLAGVAATGALVLLVVRTQGFSGAADLLIPLLFLMGLIIFAAVLYFDSRDPERKTRLSDNAFWLSLVAAPLMVHSIMWQTAIWLLGEDLRQIDQLEQIGNVLSIAVIAIFFGLLLVALVVDRRAILVSSLIYVTAVVTYLLSQTGNPAAGVSFVPIIIGGGMIAVGVFWHPLRKAVFAALPLGRIEAYLPPLRA